MKKVTIKNTDLEFLSIRKIKITIIIIKLKTLM
jgi:hypothetical protein